MNQRTFTVLLALFLCGCAAPAAPPVSGEARTDEARRQALERNIALRRAETMRKMEEQRALPPFDDIDRFMTPARAEYVRMLRVDQGYTYRALAAACSASWGANWGSNQLVGEDLWRAAAKMLGLAFP